jgi:3-isopropylmalate/(R)-2-methylmalate dehydratase large subunit
MALGATLVEKVIARAAGLPKVVPGQVVVAKVDFAFAHDSSGARRWKPILDELGVGIWDPAKVALVNDHYAPAGDAESAGFLKLTRDFARDHGIDNLFDMVGISHLVLPEAGLIRPGAFIAGGDSHTPMAGAFGAYAAGYGATDMAAIVATGETWLSVPSTIRIEWSGAFSAYVTAKDVMLFLTREIGMDNAFRAVEFAGEAVRNLPMPGRMVLCNMAAELGAETGVVAPDAITLDYLARTDRPIEDQSAALALASDADAQFERIFRFRAETLEPQIAAPHSPGNTGPVGAYAGIAIDQAYIGSCMGAKADDLRMAAEVLRGRKVARGVRLLVAPASHSTFETASNEGVLGDLIAAGAIIMPSGCGACAGYGGGVLADGEVCISSTNRNFKGRMGSPEAQVYLGSPYSVAAAAVAGKIIDPRLLMAQGLH